jgi:hypothetical protein
MTGIRHHRRPPFSDQIHSVAGSRGFPVNVWNVSRTIVSVTEQLDHVSGLVVHGVAARSVGVPFSMKPRWPVRGFSSGPNTDAAGKRLWAD